MYGGIPFVADVGEIRGVWIENKPDLVAGYVNALNTSSKVPCNVRIAKSAREAKVFIESMSPDALVVDIKLGSNIDGISFVQQVRRHRPILPVRFVSSYLDEYQERLRNVENIAGTHDRLQLEDEAFAAFREEVLADAYAHRVFRHYRIGELAWEEFLEHPMRDLIGKVHVRLFARYVRGILEAKGLAWAAVCGTKIVASAKDFDRFPSLREKEALARRFGRVPFLYTQPITSEEGFGSHNLLLDHYPRVVIEVEGSEAIADFDTGTNRTLIPEDLSTIEPASLLEPSTHLGKTYEYAINRRDIKFRSIDSVEIVGPFNMPIAIVRNWKGSPWVVVNPKRGALVGRDVLAVGRVRVQIDPRDDRKGVRTIMEMVDRGRRGGRGK